MKLILVLLLGWFIIDVCATPVSKIIANRKSELHSEDGSITNVPVRQYRDSIRAQTSERPDATTKSTGKLDGFLAKLGIKRLSSVSSTTTALTTHIKPTSMYSKPTLSYRKEHQTQSSTSRGQPTTCPTVKVFKVNPLRHKGEISRYHKSQHVHGRKHNVHSTTILTSKRNTRSYSTKKPTKTTQIYR